MTHTQRVQLNNVQYLGGHPNLVKPLKGSLVIDDKGIHMRGITEKFVISWSSVLSVDFEGPDQAAKRVTVTRLVGLGIFALAAQKRTGEAYLQVDTEEFSAMFQVPKTSAGELRAKLGRWVHRLPASRLMPLPASRLSAG